MHVTRYTDYALRVLIHLGVKGEQISTIQEIADSYGISRNHLMKVVYDLNRKGYIETLRGKHGGMRLRLEPAQINVGTLVRDTEQDFEVVECFGTSNQCRISPACQLKSILGEALGAFFKVLDSYTLADLLAPESKDSLARLLRLTPSAPRRTPRGAATAESDTEG